MGRRDGEVTGQQRNKNMTLIWPRKRAEFTVKETRIVSTVDSRRFPSHAHRGRS